MTNAASVKRINAINAITGDCFPEMNGYRLLIIGGNFNLFKTAVGDKIDGLQTLGKTERWARAVSTWADMVENAETYDGLSWAVMQGAIFTMHKA